MQCPEPRHPYPAVESLWAWLAGMPVRGLRGEAAVSEGEFADLGAWFRANEGRVRDAVGPGQLLDLCDGTRASLADLRWGIGQGPRATAAGGVAEKLRKARAVYDG